MRKVTIGVIGCGRIFPAYGKNLTGEGPFAHAVDVKSCADIMPEAARKRAEEFGIPVATTPDQLLADPDIELVVNLTVPAAHHAVNVACLNAGKSVFAEKPLAVTREEGRELLDLAASKGMHVGGAADTFLGAGLQACRRVIDAGDLGTPVAAQAFIAMGVQVARYHTVGIGPMYDMGPYYLTALFALLGPAATATGVAITPFPEKTDPTDGARFTVETPTVVSGVLRMRDVPCAATVTATTEIFNYFPRLEFYGTDGVLVANDPNMYSRPVTLTRKGAKPEELPLTGYTGEGRGLGVAEMAQAIAAGRAPRSSGALMYHVLDAMHAFHDASASGSAVSLAGSAVERPAPFDYEGELGAG
jgi:predicted dehydrogenase